ncbi:hypothetical protein AB0M41_25810 [Streptomyces sp. NPDC051896]|uniref:FAD binding domain-containing protein n=1 Tax=Streptomyces sp. NPDC051896 TaxID=3155416 RepID=UPI00341F739A
MTRRFSLARVPGVCYRLDSALRRVRVEGSDVTAEFADGYTAQGHFLVGADGIGSATRRLLDPATRPSYAGYVAWRGLEPESALPGDLLELLTGRFTFFGSDGLQMLCYLVPSPDGELTEGSRRVNTRRRHSAAGGLPPVEFERTIIEARSRSHQKDRAA